MPCEARPRNKSSSTPAVLCSQYMRGLTDVIADSDLQHAVGTGKFNRVPSGPQMFYLRFEI